MRQLENKTILVTGVLNERSIAYGIARACADAGARVVLTYQGERFERKVGDIGAKLGCELVLPCDVNDDAQIDAVFARIGERYGRLDGVVHSIAFAPREAIEGDFLDGLARPSWQVAHEVSAYSLVALAKAAAPLMTEGGSIVTVSFLGSRWVVHNYNTMGVAKACLEEAVRILAVNLGGRNIRVNGISSGPVRTLAASGVNDFVKLLRFSEKYSPLRRNVSTAEVGATAAFLLGDGASAITGQVLDVDAGLSVVVGQMPELLEQEAAPAQQPAP